MRHYNISPDATATERAFHRADSEWFTQLRIKFGDRANAARLLPEGEGEEGTMLRLAYVTYCFARDLWLEEVEAENRAVRVALANAKLRSQYMVQRAERIMGRAA